MLVPTYPPTPALVTGPVAARSQGLLLQAEEQQVLSVPAAASVCVHSAEAPNTLSGRTCLSAVSRKITIP
jgi:hypothetical protein